MLTEIVLQRRIVFPLSHQGPFYLRHQNIILKLQLLVALFIRASLVSAGNVLSTSWRLSPTDIGQNILRWGWLEVISVLDPESPISSFQGRHLLSK